MFRKRFIPLTLAIFFAAISSAAQSQPAPAEPHASAPPDSAQLLKTTEAFIRKLFAWGPDFTVKLGPLTQSLAPDFYLVPLQVTFKGQTDSGKVFISKDGKTLVRGEMFDTAADPFVDLRAKLHTEGHPSKGPANARVTLVEFADYECPHCRELHDEMPTIEARYPRIRIVFEDFPITQVHPWAQTAAIGARCAYMQSPDAFWKMNDSIFGDQEAISTENVWDKLVGFAAQAGLDTDAFKTCMTSPEALKAVEADRQQGIDMGVDSTPTVFVNGRPLPGGDITTLEQYIDFDLAAQPK
ncbi:MAG: DsbA family protein [Candidatus Acidiferrales bacterium]